MSTKIKYSGGPKGTTALSMYKSKKRGLPTLGFHQLSKPVTQASEAEIDATEPTLMLQFGGIEDINEMIGALQHLKFLHEGEKRGIPSEILDLAKKFGVEGVAIVDISAMCSHKRQSEQKQPEQKQPEQQQQD